MGEFDFSIDVDASEAFRTLELLEVKIEGTKDKLSVVTKEVEKQTVQSFKEVQGMMRASYMMVSGLSQVLGGDMARMFSSIYGVAVSAIGTYKAIATAMAASGVGAFQAAIMFSSLVTATIQMGSIMMGQTELSRRVHGINTALHGISGLIGVIGY